jgi:hypothetical protein
MLEINHLLLPEDGGKGSVRKGIGNAARSRKRKECDNMYRSVSQLF